jgi:hypothetical protein
VVRNHVYVDVHVACDPAGHGSHGPLGAREHQQAIDVGSGSEAAGSTDASAFNAEIKSLIFYSVGMAPTPLARFRCSG